MFQVSRVFGIIRDALAQGYTTICAQGSARCFAAGTMIRMYDGTLKPVDSIVVGDKVMNITGDGYNTVTETHNGIGDMCRIHQSNAEDYVVNSSHVLALYKREKGGEYEPSDISAYEYFKLSKEEQKKYRGMQIVFGINLFSLIRIEPCGRGEYFGFTLDNSPYFLLQDGTVAHNSSKTYSIVTLLCYMATNIPNTTISIVRKTRPAITGTVYRDFEEIMRRLEIWDRQCYNKSEMFYQFPNGSWIEFFPTTDDQRIRGRKRQYLYVNEGNEISFAEWTQLQLRTTVATIIDYNPSFGDEHWIVQKVIDLKSTFFFISTYKDNPFLEDKVITEIESLRETSPSLWRVYGKGQRAVIEGRVFKEYTVVDELPYAAKRHAFIGEDYGYATDPTSMVYVSIVGNTIYMKELCYRTEMTTSDIIKKHKEINREYQNNFKVWADSAEPREIAEIHNAGIDIHPVRKYAGSVKAGLMKMQEYRLVITADSINLKKELDNYTYRRDKNGTWLNEPVDAFNHCFTADTWVTTNEGQKPIVNVFVGDLVLTSQGYRKVTHFFNNGTRKTIHARLTFTNGQSVVLKATPGHKIKTTKGWKQLQEIEPQDVLYLCKSLMERNTNCTVASVTSPTDESGCTEKFGNTIMAIFRKALTYTTSTAIRTTTALRTLNWSSVRNTITNTQKNIAKTLCGWRERVRQWITPEPTQISGTARKQVENGIASMVEMSQQNLNQLLALVNTAARNTGQCRMVSTASAPTTVNQQRGEKAELTTKQGCVPIAERSLSSTNIHEHNSVQEVVLESIIILSEQSESVFDIEVDDMHEFFANGVLAHNCIDAVRYVVLSEVLGRNGGGLDAQGLADLL